MPNTNFIEARRMLVHFVNARMFMSTFERANAKDVRFSITDLRMVNFTLANLQRTEFWDTSSITDEQLKSALSIRDARLFKGTLERDRNLIKNGHIDCNSSVSDSWLLHSGRVIPIRPNENSGKCHFILQSLNTGAIMSQRVKLSNIWNSDLWPYSHAVLNAQMGNNVSIQLSGFSNIGKILGQRNSSKYILLTISVYILSYVQAHLKVT